ncbi:MAG: deoxyribodipyrimidine photo-lyase [Bdellovibrionales bacterium]|nr:deoxyribodipyrimidine photo-lyase [Bdellovibrionales bacterium]
MSIENWVWLKRDLRASDNQALLNARKNGLCGAFFVYEPEWLSHPSTSDIHLQFATESLAELELKLKKLGIPLLIFQADIETVLSELKNKCGLKRLFSHEETGLAWSYARDIAVGNWCKAHSIYWQESRQFSVIRGLKDRNRWNQARSKIIERPTLAKPEAQQPPKLIKLNGQIDLREVEFRCLPDLQAGGRQAADDLLQSFLSERGHNYRTEMSSPVTAYDSCSRLSPHIAWGTISITEITEALRGARAELQHFDGEFAKTWRQSLKSFESRLWWHCHFIQKLESEPDIEFHNMNRGFDGMREESFNNDLFEAWKAGETGFPMIDACMLALKKYGWINFRMRAMLISFASYQLWLHWKKPSQHLSRLFVDFEPGIHYSQIQMQSGVTGINTVRIYSPTKQGLDKDPEGEFIKRMLPALEGLDASQVHSPEKTPPMMQTLAGCRIGLDYPEPIVDPKKSYQEAKSKIFSWRSKPEVRSNSKRVYQKHGSRKNQFFPSQHRRDFGNWNKDSDSVNVGIESDN